MGDPFDPEPDQHPWFVPYVGAFVLIGIIVALTAAFDTGRGGNGAVAAAGLQFEAVPSTRSAGVALPGNGEERNALGDLLPIGEATSTTVTIDPALATSSTVTSRTTTRPASTTATTLRSGATVTSAAPRPTTTTTTLPPAFVTVTWTASSPTKDVDIQAGPLVHAATGSGSHTFRVLGGHYKVQMLEGTRDGEGRLQGRTSRGGGVTVSVVSGETVRVACSNVDPCRLS